MAERSADLSRTVGEQARQSQGDANANQDDGKRNPFGGLIDGAKGIFNKAKKEVEKIDADDVGDAVGKAGRAIGNQAERIGAGGVGQQAKDIAGSAERQIRGQGTQADRDRLIGAGVEAGKLAIGGGSLNVADQLLKRGIIPGGSLGGLFNRGAKEITRLDTLGFVKAVRENWDTLDTDKNGYVSQDDIKKASEDKIFALKNAHMLSVLESMHEPLSNCQNDEFGDETSGVTKADIYALEKGKLEGTGFGGVAAAGKGAWDAKVPAALAGVGTSYLSRAKPVGSMLSRGGLAVAGIAAVGGIYGTIDYYGSRKENIEKVISELK